MWLNDRAKAKTLAKTMMANIVIKRLQKYTQQYIITLQIVSLSMQRFYIFGFNTDLFFQKIYSMIQFN